MVVIVKKYLCSMLVLFKIGCVSGMITMPRDRAELLINHLQVMRELKTVAAKKGHVHPDNPYSTGLFSGGYSPAFDKYYSQTDAHLSFPYLQEKVLETWGDFFNEHEDFIDNIIAIERQHSDDYFVFYHAQRKEFLIAQDFIKEIFELLHICEQQNAFTFLRFWGKIPPALDVNAFIDNNNSKGDWSDNDAEFATLLLSVNLSLFGNCTRIAGWECTFDYFLNDRSVMFGGCLVNILTNIFDFFEFDKQYLQPLLSLLPIIKQSKQGLLFQICIPKNLVDQSVYLSWAGGFPYNFPVPGGKFDKDKNRNLRISPILSLYAKGRSGFDKLRKTSALFIDTLKKFEISDLDIAEAIMADRFQARILFSQDVMLNPASGVEIFRYTMIDDAVMAEYEASLKKITHEIVAQWLENNDNRISIQGSKLDMLLTQVTRSDVLDDGLDGLNNMNDLWLPS